MTKLRNIFYGLTDSARLAELARYFDSQATEVRLLAEAARASLARSAELTARLDAWRETQAPFKRERNVQIMRLARRGWHDDDIAREVGCSGRTVRRVIRAELRPRGNGAARRLAVRQLRRSGQSD